MPTQAVELTPEEEAEFTYLNLLAFDIARKEAKQTDTKIPAWLCSSDDAKNRHRDNALAILNKALRPIVPFTAGPTIERVIRESVPSGTLAMWKEAETELKRHRADGNPHAFFC